MKGWFIKAVFKAFDKYSNRAGEGPGAGAQQEVELLAGERHAPAAETCLCGQQLEKVSPDSMNNNY